VPDDPRSRLLSPGERLGWVFRDRNRFRRPYGHPPPSPPAPPADLVNQLHRVRRQLPLQMVIAGGAGILLTGVFGCCANVFDSRALAFGVLAFLAFAGGVAGIALIATRYARLKSKVDAAQAERRQWYETAYQQWSAHKEAFESEDRQRVEQMLEWGAASPGPGTRRVDIVGGTLWGWEAVLTVFGASSLATRGSLTLVDLSGEAVSRELLRVAGENGVGVDMLLLPTELAESDLLVGLSTRELVDALVESMYGDSETADRADRSMDNRILTGICQALGDDVSLGRLGAAMRVLMNETRDVDVLTPDERRYLADEVFSADYRRESYPNLRRMEAFIHPLADLGTRRGVRPAAPLTCLAMATDGHNARNELLTDLIVQWLVRRVAHDDGGLRSLMIAGADDIPRRHLERLTDLCERRDVRLVLLFRHLRGPALSAIGGGSVGFMRLGNHEEARQAAEFIGREHRFVLSQLTRTLGGSETHSVADTEGVDTTEGRSRDLSGVLGGALHRWTRDERRNWSVTRRWSQTRSVADGTKWSDASAEQRVYEYAVEPTTLQHLPDYAMLMVSRQPDGSSVQSVECNPDLVSLPRLAMDPLPYEPLPAPPQALPAAAQRPTAGQP
jgi:hypothetical protein